MRWENVFVQAMVATLLPGAEAYPGGKMTKLLDDIKVVARGLAPIDSPQDSNELIGDLVTPGPTSTVGQVSSSFVQIDIASDKFSWLQTSSLEKQMVVVL
jgi:hypothetical protein